MIPKKIHYVWLGGDQKPQLVKDCIATWRKYLPGYEIIEWNENNWDISQSRFARENYQAGKYAYVSDVIRLDVLYQYGGIYLDTDVIVNKSFDQLLDNHTFWGKMYNNVISTAVIGTEAKRPFFEFLLKKYQEYTREMMLDKKIDHTNNSIITLALLDYYPEFTLLKKKQVLSDGTLICPKEYFELPTFNRKINFSEHKFARSWDQLQFSFIKRMLKKWGPKILGSVIFGKITGYRGAKRYRNVYEAEKKRNIRLKEQRGKQSDN